MKHRPVRVAVAMSGGVDSSVAAALLKEQGLDVIGLTMRIWDPVPEAGAGGRGCCGFRAIDDARRVAARLGIPHYTLDFRAAFRRWVIADFCAEYAKGQTPNPCIRCNRFLKFDILLRKAGDLGARYLATGHYARTDAPEPGSRRRQLRRPKDRNKDQTYFLYSVTQPQLRRTLFPLGALTKSEVRAIARRYGLVTADKKESQEVCFAPGGSYPAFLRSRFPELARPGPILDSTGRPIGRHDGIILYTVGQRRRIGIAAREPLYCLAIDPEGNTITVGPRAQAFGRDFNVTDLNWIGIPRPTTPLRCRVQIRYRHQAAPARVVPHGRNSAHVRFETAQWAVTPGQAAVFYSRNRVLGGGTILRPEGITAATRSVC